MQVSARRCWKTMARIVNQQKYFSRNVWMTILQMRYMIDRLYKCKNTFCKLAIG